VGTEDFVAPEIIEGKESSYCADLWSLGVIIYQLLTGKSLFKGASQFYTFENIQQGKFELPDCLSAPTKDIINKLLVIEP
jgi:3-phosphoinositide dependent protein kinase-1